MTDFKIIWDGPIILVQPANADMEPIIVKEGGFKIQGVVIGVLRKF